MPMTKQPLTVELALLGFLRKEPKYGYEIYQHLTESRNLGLVWSIKQSLLYALLTRLEEEGYLRSNREDQQTRPARKMLHLTPVGEAAFTTWVSSPVPYGRDFRLEFLAKLYFARQDSQATAQTLINLQLDATAARLAELHERARQLNQTRSYDWLVLRFRIGQLSATVEWLDLCAQWAQNPAEPPPPRDPDLLSDET